MPDAMVSWSNLRWLDVSYTNVRGPIPDAACSMIELKVLLCFIDSKLSRTVPIAFGGMTGLQHVNLKRNRLTGSLPDVLCWQRLELLLLAANKLSGSLPSSFACMSKVGKLHLEINMFSGSIPDAVAAMTDITFFDLSLNRWSGSIPDSLGHITHVSEVYLQQNCC